MIKITFDVDKFKLTVKGHSKYGEKGKDIVCAGVSALVGALAQTSIDLNSGSSFAKKPKLNIKEGNTTIQLYPKEEYKETISLVLYPILEGFMLLAETYPDYVNMG